MLHALTAAKGLRFETIPSRFDEKSMDKSKFTPQEYVQENARQKALEVVQRLPRGLSHVVIGAYLLHTTVAQPSAIGADSVVVCCDEILEKPESDQHAAEMLRQLSGNRHYVASGVAVIVCDASGGVEEHTLVSQTDVVFDKLSEEEISEYLRHGKSSQPKRIHLSSRGSHGQSGRIRHSKHRWDVCHGDCWRLLYGRGASSQSGGKTIITVAVNVVELIKFNKTNLLSFFCCGLVTHESFQTA